MRKKLKRQSIEPCRKWRHHGGGGLGDSSEKSAKLSKKNGVELVGYTFRQKNYVKIPVPTSFGFFRANVATAHRKKYKSIAQSKLFRETANRFVTSKILK